jgi:hypothetical protein
MKRKTLMIVVLVLALVGVIAYGAVNYMAASLRLALADEQTEILQNMVTKSHDALSQSPPDVSKAVGYLCYAHRYYPSGTKQLTGSRLDRIVERTRSLAEMRIIDMLRKETGEDHGEVAEAWIRAFNEKRNVQHRLSAGPPSADTLPAVPAVKPR